MQLFRLSASMAAGCLAIWAGLLTAAEREATSPSSITALPGFQVTLLRSAQEGEGSWISLTFDPQGRIIVGIDDRGLGRLTIDPGGQSADFERLLGTEALQHVRGVLYANDSLYACATDSQQIYRLRDTTGDDQFDQMQLLKQVDYRSRYGHGTNQIVKAPATGPWADQPVAAEPHGGAPAPQSLYVVTGNDVSFPEGSDPVSPYRDPRNDWLLPSPHDGGHDDRVGHIIRIDPSGERWTIVAGGFRNQFDIAFNEAGEMFTWDADMEWDVGLPWYRPTRLNHVVSGGEYGWRWGTGKWPAWYPDSLPSTLDTGLGSPTGLVFGGDSRWPERFQKALLMADWQHGRILLVDLIPQGASYAARSSLFLEGGPLNVCDMAFGPDGDLYFITGGRGSQSGLYRVSFTGASATDESPTLDWSAELVADSEQHRQARQTRHRLERYHIERDVAALDFIWQQLGSHDVWLRFAARVALENQPLAGWRDRVRHEPDSLARRTALLALSRVGTSADQSTILAGLADIDLRRLSAEELLLPLRTLQLSLIRQGMPEPEAVQPLRDRIDSLFPHDSFPVNWLLSELLVYWDAPLAAERTLELLQRAPTQEEQIQYAKTLVARAAGLSEPLRLQLLQWLVQSRGLPGGRLVAATLANIRQDIEQVLTGDQRQRFAELLAQLDQPLDDDLMTSPSSHRPLVKQWTMDDLLEDVLAIEPATLSRQTGQAALAAAACLRCHAVGQRGGQIGPDLTNIGKRMDGRALLESILEPSRQIDPKYQHTVFLLADGQVVTGRPTSVTRSQMTIEIDPLTGRAISIDRDQIEHAQPSEVSPMPAGLLDTLDKPEILALIAWLRDQ